MVLRGLDDRVLWTAIAAGVGITLLYRWVQSTAPWLTWSWSDSLAHGAIYDTPTPIGAVTVVVLGAADVATPLALLFFFAPAIMGAYAGSTERWSSEGPPHPAVRGALLFGALALFGTPPLVAVLYALTTVFADAALGHFSLTRVGGRSHPEQLPVSQSAAGLAASPRPVQAWDRIDADARDRCARSAAFHLIVVIAILNTHVFPILLRM
jgi:hypothetical protein